MSMKDHPVAYRKNNFVECSCSKATIRENGSILKISTNYHVLTIKRSQGPRNKNPLSRVKVRLTIPMIQLP